MNRKKVRLHWYHERQCTKCKRYINGKTETSAYKLEGKKDYMCSSCYKNSK